MRINYIFLILCIIALAFGCQQPSVIEPANRLSGLWTLHLMEQQDSVTGDWSEWRGVGMQGYILYHDNNSMAMHLTTKGYENTDLQFPNFIDTIPLEALKYITNSYVYFANYTVDEQENIVQHNRFTHSNPSEWNDVVRRRYSFNGDTLILRPVGEQRAGLRLKWLKVK